MDMKRTIAATILIAAFSVSVQASYPIVRHFSKNTYKAGTQTWCITEQPDHGPMYFANNSGLLEYDGTSWECYPIANRTNVRSAFFDDEDGRIYAGGFKEFGYYTVDENAGITYHTIMDGYDDESMKEIWAIHRIGEDFYLRCDRAIYRYSEDGVRTFHFSGRIDCSAVIKNTLVVSSAEDGMQMLVGEQFISLPSTEWLTGKKICGIEPIDDARAAFVTESGEIYEYDWKEVHRAVPWRNLNGQRIFCTASDREWLALGTVGNGVFLYNRRNGEDIHLDIGSGLQNNTVLSMKFDSSGNLWLGLDKGIDYVIVNSPERSLFRSENIYGTGYTSAIYEGRLYLGTNQGLYHMDYPPKDDMNHETIMEIKSLKGQVWYLEQIDGLLFCGHDTGLYTVRGDTVRKIDGVSGTWKVKKMRKVDGRLIGSSYDGMFFLKKDSSGEWVLDSYLKGFDQHSGRFEEDSDGKIWVYHWITGLWRLTLSPDGVSVSSTDYFGMNYGLPSDHNNIVNRYRNSIAMSSDAGFYRYDQSKDRIIPIKSLNDIFPTPPKGLSMIESPYNDLFFMSDGLNGIAFYEPDGTYTLDTLSLKFLHKKQIFGFEHISFIDRNNILINTENGFSLVDIGKIRTSRHGETGGRVFIKNIHVSHNGNDSLIYSARRPDILQKEIRLPYSDNSVKFEFVCPEYNVENGIEYSYRLNGFDKKWSEFSTFGIKEYTKLPPGSYVFNVRARNRYSHETSGTSLSFSITPPWYRTIAAYALYSIILALGIYLLMRYASMKSEERARRIASEKEVEIKILKSQNLEHDLKHKSQNLASSTMNVIRKNEILMQIQHDISRSLQYMEENEDTRSRRILQKIQHDIVENIEHDDYWTQFEANFDIVYEDYLKRLGEKYQSLTINDKKLCAYLKMGLCSKEIAPLLNLSVHSVEMARYRLRKKMNLSRDTNLTDYLQHF